MRELLAEIDHKFRAGSNHTFLFHLNVDDIFLDEKGKNIYPRSLTELLVSHPPFNDASYILVFNLATGLTFLNNMEDKFLEAFKDADPKKVEEYIKLVVSGDDLGATLMLLSFWLPRADEKKPGKKPLISVIIENLDTVVPPEAPTSSCHIDRKAFTSILTWAKDPQIKRAGNPIALITDNVDSLPKRFRSETSDIALCEIELPDQFERRRIYDFAVKKHGSQAGDMDPVVFAKSSGGMSAKAIINLVGEQVLRKQPVSPDMLFKRKKKFIEDKSGGLLEVQRPLWGIEAVGALDKVKEYILNVARDIHTGKRGGVPNGILLLGPPGTGKTVLAEALAHEADIPFLVMKNIKNPYVGQSTINQNYAFGIMKANQPVVVFEDEIDQRYQIRSALGDNTNVNQDLMAGFLKFAGDTNWRGMILWMAATNKPHLIDEAIIRSGRFDIKIPFFPYSTSERASVTKALLRKNEILATSQGDSFEWNLSDEDIRYFARRAHCHTRGIGKETQILKCNEEEDHSALGLDDEADGDKEVFYTGGDIENIIQRARMKASSENKPLNKEHLMWALNDFIPGQDIADYERMIRSSVEFCNSATFLPTKGRWSKLASRKGVFQNSPSKPNFSE